MKLVRLIIPAALVMTLTGGCLVSGRVGVRAHVAEPDLVLVSPGVYVISDHDEPVFYSEGSYWWYRGGYWYSSRVHTGGWVRVNHVPVIIGRIDRPHGYVHYRGRGHVRARPESRDHRVRATPRARPDNRDHRDHRVRPAPAAGNGDRRKAKPKRPPTKGRDHRGD